MLDYMLVGLISGLLVFFTLFCFSFVTLGPDYRRHASVCVPSQTGLRFEKSLRTTMEQTA